MPAKAQYAAVAFMIKTGSDFNISKGKRAKYLALCNIIKIRVCTNWNMIYYSQIRSFSPSLFKK